MTRVEKAKHLALNVLKIIGVMVMVVVGGLAVLIYTLPGPKSTELKVPSICSKNQITMVSATWCIWCKTAKESFNKSGIEFHEILTDKLPKQERQTVISKYEPKGFKGFPFFVVTDKTGKESYVSGWNHSAVLLAHCK